MITDEEPLRGNVPKKKRRPGYCEQVLLTSSLMACAVGPASDGGSQSSQGFAREITEIWMLCLSMKAIFRLMS